MTPKRPLKIIPDARNGSDDSPHRGSPSALDRDIAARLRLAREKQSLNHEELAARIGISVDLYIQLETGTRRIGAWYLSRLAMALDLPISWFFVSPSNEGRSAQQDQAIIPGSGGRIRSDSETRIADLRQRLDDVIAGKKRD